MVMSNIWMYTFGPGICLYSPWLKAAKIKGSTEVMKDIRPLVSVRYPDTALA